MLFCNIIYAISINILGNSSVKIEVFFPTILHYFKVLMKKCRYHAYEEDRNKPETQQKPYVPYSKGTLFASNDLGGVR